jgi:hypothetical protein
LRDEALALRDDLAADPSRAANDPTSRNRSAGTFEAGRLGDSGVQDRISQDAESAASLLFRPYGRALQRLETIFLLVSFIADLTAR